MAEAPRSHWFAVRNSVPGDESVTVSRRLIWKPGETTGSWRRFSNKREAPKMRSMEAASWKTTNARRSVKRGSGKTGARLKHREQSKPAPTAAGSKKRTAESRMPRAVPRVPSRRPSVRRQQEAPREKRMEISYWCRRRGRRADRRHWSWR